ncbi:hypothetical protein GCK32_000818 [Trichostrongylus colubriformis]|uniref:EGF-like domain-containing protein n=1 Tax=Trichostrongylus colubriformis TaxID=6319 RepID=A0AAN8FQA5_TRICO
MRMAAFLNINYEGDDLLPAMLVVFNLLPVSIFLAVMSFTIIINFGVALVIQVAALVLCLAWLVPCMIACSVSALVIWQAIQFTRFIVGTEDQNIRNSYKVIYVVIECVQCVEGWTGVDCDAIQCNGHGSPNYDLTSCNCEKPYSGQFCETFTTRDIYSYYNTTVSRTGAIGVLTCIPLLLIYLICDCFAKKRQRDRIAHQLAGTLILTNPENLDRRTINKETISHLLYKD